MVAKDPPDPQPGGNYTSESLSLNQDSMKILIYSSLAAKTRSQEGQHETIPGCVFYDSKRVEHC
jgi:hypothetical protein